MKNHMDKTQGNGKKSVVINSRKKRYGQYHSALQNELNDTKDPEQTNPENQNSGEQKNNISETLERITKETSLKSNSESAKKEKSISDISEERTGETQKKSNSGNMEKKKNAAETTERKTRQILKNMNPGNMEKKKNFSGTLEKKTKETPKKNRETFERNKKDFHRKNSDRRRNGNKKYEKVERRENSYLIEEEAWEKNILHKDKEELSEMERNNSPKSGLKQKEFDQKNSIVRQPEKEAQKEAEREAKKEVQKEAEKEAGKETKREVQKEAQREAKKNTETEGKIEAKKKTETETRKKVEAEEERKTGRLNKNEAEPETEKSLQEMMEGYDSETGPEFQKEENERENHKDSLKIIKMISLVVFDIGWAALVVCAVIWFFDVGYSKKNAGTQKETQSSALVEDRNVSEGDDLQESSVNETNEKAEKTSTSKKENKSLEEEKNPNNQSDDKENEKNKEDEKKKDSEEEEKSGELAEETAEAEGKYNNIYIVEDGKVVKAGNIYMTETEMIQKVFEYQNLDAGEIVDVEAFNSERIHDMFYSQEIDDRILGRIYGKSCQENPIISMESLHYLRMLYYGFDGETHIGEMIVNVRIEEDVLAIFEELYMEQYPIERMVLVDEYDADDEKSMAANNTSCFNYRYIANTSTYSQHAYGMAVDINPKYNPYITYASDGSWIVAPKNGEEYAGRDRYFKYKIDETDLCYKLFIEHGFSWGGSWTSSKDYQHFERKY